MMWCVDYPDAAVASATGFHNFHAFNSLYAVGFGAAFVYVCAAIQLLVALALYSVRQVHGATEAAVVHATSRYVCCCRKAVPAVCIWTGSNGCCEMPVEIPALSVGRWRQCEASACVSADTSPSSLQCESSASWGLCVYTPCIVCLWSACPAMFTRACVCVSVCVAARVAACVAVGVCVCGCVCMYVWQGQRALPWIVLRSWELVTGLCLVYVPSLAWSCRLPAWWGVLDRRVPDRRMRVRVHA